jgi:hypothetical protein
MTLRGMSVVRFAPDDKFRHCQTRWREGGVDPNSLKGFGANSSDGARLQGPEITYTKHRRAPPFCYHLR